MSKRPSWDEYFLSITKEVAKRSTCLRRQVGAILVMDKHILTTGYNGAPSGLQHCLDIGCLREQLKVPPGERHELCRGLHAEMNALLQASRYGIKISGATLYTTTYPCSLCAKMLVNAGIQHIVTITDYPDPLAKDILSMAKINVEIFEQEDIKNE
ncbi:MAG TPA: deoxycytidylate deaminase [Candidatus Wujingus californicus]|uniref:deoxycytidylate deaminase n=1 Tax=Candidatus Wujingus californicus TaxID=3367618 RepID=UPI001D383529|nr:cytidine/deoxycytidylate deaminase family protein [Planctomycetota bacterium]MDO8131796.1 cytidine/deoxycytidylate deaminase family protein [Candidatus Brocadiales bacterium]